MKHLQTPTTLLMIAVLSGFGLQSCGGGANHVRMAPASPDEGQQCVWTQSPLTRELELAPHGAPMGLLEIDPFAHQFAEGSGESLQATLTLQPSPLNLNVQAGDRQVQLNTHLAPRILERFFYWKGAQNRVVDGVFRLYAHTKVGLMEANGAALTIYLSPDLHRKYKTKRLPKARVSCAELLLEPDESIPDDDSQDGKATLMAITGDAPLPLRAHHDAPIHGHIQTHRLGQLQRRLQAYESHQGQTRVLISIDEHDLELQGWVPSDRLEKDNTLVASIGGGGFGMRGGHHKNVFACPHNVQLLLKHQDAVYSVGTIRPNTHIKVLKPTPSQKNTNHPTIQLPTVPWLHTRQKAKLAIQRDELASCRRLQ